MYYDPSFLKGEITSIVHLYHELCHAYNFVTGTIFPGYGPDGVDADNVRQPVPNAELQAVGLRVSAPPSISTGTRRHRPGQQSEAFSENGLRQEFGIPPRKQYRGD
ncbi:M91 family zinc metallopeptidase [Pseudomonas sp. PCH446]